MTLLCTWYPKSPERHRALAKKDCQTFLHISEFPTIQIGLMRGSLWLFRWKLVHHVGLYELQRDVTQHLQFLPRPWCPSSSSQLFTQLSSDRSPQTFRMADILLTPSVFIHTFSYGTDAARMVSDLLMNYNSVLKFFSQPAARRPF